MRKLSIILALFLCAGAYAQKQNMNPTVTVTNRFSSEMSNFQMQTGKTQVPDSLYHFDLNFDYTGFEVQYKGNDSFNPIHTELDMSARPYDGKRFTMTAATGYGVPVLFDMNAVLKQSGRFKLGFYASNDSFWGNYSRILPYEDGWLYPDSKTMKGYDSRTKIGFDGRLDWKKSHLLMDLKYDGIHASMSEMGTKNLYNSLIASAKYRYRSDGCFRMGIDGSYTLGGYEGGQRTSPLTIIENIYNADLFFTFAIAKVHLIDLEGSFKMTDSFNANVKGSSFGGYTVVASPMYYFSGNDKVYLGLGASLLYSASVANVDTGSAFTGFPRLKFRWKAVRDYFIIYADASLDGEVWGLGSNARENIFYVADSQKTVVKNYKSELGFGGNIAGHLQYKIFGGYSNIQGAPLCAVTMDATFGGPVTYIVHEKNLRSVNAGASLWSRFGSFTFSADALYRYYLNASQMTALPTWLEASADLKYEYRSRFWIHAGAVYNSDYKAGTYKVPYYVDLKAGLGFNIRKSFSVFIEGKNLLNYSRQDVPLYSRNGFEIMAGIKLLY